MGVHDAVKSSYMAFGRRVSDNRLLDYKWLLEQEVDTWKQWVSLPLGRRLWLWRHGFTSPCGTLYDFETYGPEAYLSELQRYRLYEAANGRHRYLIDDKLAQSWMLADYPDHRPTAFGFVDRGRVHGVAGTAFDGDTAPVADWLPGTLRAESKLVCKKLRGKGGKEVLVLAYDDGYLLDGQPVTERELCAEVASLSGYLLTEFVDQHGYADELYPYASNTIRILSVWDDEAGDLHFPIATQRIGTDRSRPVDNFSAGGIVSEVDRETGELGRAVQLPFSGEVRWYATHPDTGSRVEGTTVPHWNRVRSTVERIARDNTNIPIIGWDVLLDESGEPVVLEANTGTTVQMLQAHRPLFEDDGFAAVAARHLDGVEARGTRREPSTVAPHEVGGRVR